MSIPTTTAAAGGSPFRAAVLAMATHVRPGEWAAHGDLAEAAGYTQGHAMSVGNIWADVELDEGLPHVRMLRNTGEVPPNAPEWVRHVLRLEGVRFLPNGRANQIQRVPLGELRRRDAAAQLAAS